MEVLHYIRLLRRPDKSGLLAMTSGMLLAMTIAAGFFIFAPPVHAASYSAEIVEPAAKMTLAPGERGTVSVLIKNTGSLAWPVTGRGYVSAYTFDPKYHLSRLEDKSWRRRDQPATIAAAVKPGASGYLRFPVLAPLETGVYEETFQLAAEDTAWIDGGKFVITVGVIAKNTSVIPGASTRNPDVVPAKAGNQLLDSHFRGNDKAFAQDDKSEIASSSGTPRNDTVLLHKALLLARSHRKIEAAGGENILMRFGFKNVGETTWIERGIGYADVALALVDSIVPPKAGLQNDNLEILKQVQDDSVSGVQDDKGFAHESWVSAREVVKIASGTVAPGQTEFFTFNVRTPAKAGSYNLRLSLMAGGQAVSGGEIEVPVTVTADAASTSGEPVVVPELVLAPEPRIRVGLFKPEQPVEFRSPFAYVLRDANGLIMYELPTSTQAVVHFKEGSPSTLRPGSGQASPGTYTFYAQGTTLTSETQFRLEPKAVLVGMDPGSGQGPVRDDSGGVYFELLNHEDRPKWNRAINYNQFRGVFELRYSKENDKVWAINELPMEEYLAGLAEVSENKVPEFYKAQAVASRTYAYYQLQDGRKHASRNFDVNASQGDQVYAGYVREQTFINGADGVRATRGEMMTYNKDVVVTPYFAQSDGKTRTWKQAWGGADKPWLVSVTTHYDKGRTRYGHGVGMSQYDAAKRAEKEGADYKTLLKYYYQGVEVERIFK
ncbi:MAG: SpoIID/LytB domain-containing protein [Candidatus Magasanikbacteria bacterium]|nr:SpoIID/LytB domain-containing protein [Candidatus Magasanikbacteria bacterium]